VHPAWVSAFFLFLRVSFPRLLLALPFWQSSPLLIVLSFYPVSACGFFYGMVSDPSSLFISLSCFPFSGSDVQSMFTSCRCQGSFVIPDRDSVFPIPSGVLFRSSTQYHFSSFSVLLACLCLSARDFSTGRPVLHWSRDLSFVSALVCLLVSSVDSLLSTREAGDRFYLLFAGPS
jgi:hypothetical protein